MSDALPARRFRRGLFGYRRRDVDAFLLDVAEPPEAPADELGRHLSGLLTRFAETVNAGEQDAADQAARVIADAEEEAERIKAEARQLLTDSHALAAATFTEAERRHEAVTSAHTMASEQIDNAIQRLTDALSSLQAIPELPDLTLPTAIFAGETVELDATDDEPVADVFIRLA